jgi:hypothetical protein
MKYDVKTLNNEGRRAPEGSADPAALVTTVVII